VPVRSPIEASHYAQFLCHLFLKSHCEGKEKEKWKGLEWRNGGWDGEKRLLLPDREFGGAFRILNSF